MTGPVGSRVSSSISAAVLEYLATSSMARARPEDARARSPVLDRDAQPEQAGVAEGLEDVGRVGALLVDGPGPGLDLVLGQAPDRIAELQKLVGKVEIHR